MTRNKKQWEEHVTHSAYIERRRSISDLMPLRVGERLEKDTVTFSDGQDRVFRTVSRPITDFVPIRDGEELLSSDVSNEIVSISVSKEIR